MKKIIFITAFLFLCLPVIIFGNENETEIRKEKDGHTFVFRIGKELFNPEEHDLTRLNEDIIDGKEAYGICNSIPGFQISKFECTIDGKKLDIPKDIYISFYEPHILLISTERENKNIDAFWGNDLQSVFVFMNGSDGGGGYSVVWILKKDGNHNFCIPPIFDLAFMFEW